MKGSVLPTIKQTDLVSLYQSGVEHQLQPFAVYLTSQTVAEVMLIKGHPSKIELAVSAPFSAEERTALKAAFEALGWGFASWIGVLLAPQGIPVLSEQQLRLIIEIIDPELVLALDNSARLALQQAMAVQDGHETIDRAAAAGGLADIGETTVHGVLQARQTPEAPLEANSPTTIQVGEQIKISGRQILALEDLAASLSDAESKQIVWAQLKQIRR